MKKMQFGINLKCLPESFSVFLLSYTHWNLNRYYLKCSSGTEKLNTLLKESKRSEDIRDIPHIFFNAHMENSCHHYCFYFNVLYYLQSVIRWETSKSFILMKRERCLNSAQLENRIYVTIMIFLTHSGRKISIYQFYSSILMHWNVASFTTSISARKMIFVLRKL